MSKLDDILADLVDFHEPPLKRQIKVLMLETYNGALQLWIDKKAPNLDEAFAKKVEEL